MTMEQGASSCESTATSVSPLPLRGGRRTRQQGAEELCHYKIGSILVWALAYAGVPFGVEELQLVVRILTHLLVSVMSTRLPHGERIPSETRECTERVVSENAHWNPGLDWIFINAMLEHESSWAGSTFTVPGWQMILTRFNYASCLNYTKAQLLYRWKNSKKDYAAYLYLHNKSGWGWDGIYNRPIAPSDSTWFELADKYRKYHNKPFLYFGDIQRFLSKDITTGVHTISSRPPRDIPSFGASFSPPSQKELNFDENLDECMLKPEDDFEASEDVTPTPSRKRNSSGGRGNSKKSKSGASWTGAGQEVLQNFLSSLSLKITASKNGPEDVALAACTEIGVMRPDLDADQIDKIAEKLAMPVGRNAYMIARADLEKLKS